MKIILYKPDWACRMSVNTMCHLGILEKYQIGRPSLIPNVSYD